MSSISPLSDPTWLATYAPGNVDYWASASSLVSEQSTLSALLAPQSSSGSPFFGSPALLDPTAYTAGTSALGAAEAQDPALADQVTMLSSEGSLLNVLA